MAENVKLTIFQDKIADSPREWDNLGKMICFHKEYSLGDEHDYESPKEFIQNLSSNHTEYFILPLYLLDHSGIWMNTTGFAYCDPQGWDWGQVGWIYVTRKKLREEGLESKTDDEIYEYLENEVKIYNQYLQGDVWGFVLEKETDCSCCGQAKTEVLDSCWGFYGRDWEKNGMTEQIPEKYLHLLVDASHVLAY